MFWQNLRWSNKRPFRGSKNQANAVVLNMKYEASHERTLSQVVTTNITVITIHDVLNYGIQSTKSNNQNIHRNIKSKLLKLAYLTLVCPSFETRMVSDESMLFFGRTLRKEIMKLKD